MNATERPPRSVLLHTHLAFEFPDLVAEKASAFPEVSFVAAEDTDDFRDRITEADVVVTAPIERDLLDTTTRLRLHVVPFAGVNRVPLAWYSEHNVLLASSHGNAQAVAERGVALLYAAAGRIVEFDRDLRRGLWHRRADEHRPFDYWRSLSGGTVAILGTGAIGTQTATLLRPLMGEIRGFRRRKVDSHPSSGSAHSPFDSIGTDLVDTITGCHVVVVTLPLTAETEGVLTKEILRTTDEAILVNISRAEVIPEDDLWSVLTDGTLYAAGIDVWYRNPSPFWQEGPEAMPSTHPFHTLDNVVLSPHAGSHSEEGKRGQLIEALAHVEEYLQTGSISRGIATHHGY